MNSIQLKSRAKINLSIDVLGKRKDGYHLVEMIMQTIDLYDIIKIKELDILKALLDEEVMFDLFESNVTSVTPKSWLKAKYPDWVGKPGVNNEKMVLAKVNINGQVFNIINKIDLEVLQNLLGKDFSKNLHDLREFDV